MIELIEFFSIKKIQGTDMSLKFFISSMFIFLNCCYASEVVNLSTPDLSESKIIAYSTGLRPYRKKGIRLEAERIGNKLIIHDYGHGGSGISLSWGCAQEAINILKNNKNMPAPIAILGAGVIGLTTAHLLKDQGYDVTVYADTFVPFTTSNRAAGLFSPDFALGDMPEDLVLRLKQTSYLKFYNLAHNIDTEFQGVFVLPSYSEKSQLQVTDVLPDSHVIVNCNNVTKVCRKRSDIVFDLNIYLTDLFEKAKVKGVVFEMKKMSSINDLQDLKQKVVFNCTGLGSRELFNDTDLVPVKGHLVIFSAQPNINYVVTKWHQQKNTFFSLIPWKTQLLLAGTMEEGIEDLAVDQETVNVLMNNAKSFFNM